MSTELFRTMAAYNEWANARLYEAASRLSDDQYRADRGAFFRSVEGTLNHILIADRIWMHRFTGKGEASVPLSAVLFDTLGELSKARIAEDRRIRIYAEGLDDAALAGTFSYTRATTPERFTQQLGPALMHVFNHQTHHRGQAHCILTGLGREGPVMDLLFFQRETGIGMA